MADVTAVPIDNNGFSENVANRFLTFQDWIDYTINSGTGLIEKEAQSPYTDSNIYVFSGNNSLKVSNLDYQNTDLVFSNSNVNHRFVSNAPKNYWLSFFVLNPSGLIDTTLRLDVFQDATPFNTYVFDLNAENIPDTNQFYRFGQNIFFDSGYEYTFKWTLVKDATHATNNKTIYISGFAIQCLNKATTEYAPYSIPKTIEINVTETINVDNIVDGTTEKVDATVTGAIVGDFVKMTYPVALLTAGLEVCYPIVTADDTVSFLIRNNTGGDINPASGNYTFKIVR